MKPITCEQVFNIWSTDPQLITIADVRPMDEFQRARIPGSKHLSLTGLLELLAFEKETLILILGSEFLDERMLHKLSHCSNVMFVDECWRWKSLNFPLVGEDLKPEDLSLRKGELAVYPIRTGQENALLMVDSASKEACFVGEGRGSELARIEEQGGIRILYHIKSGEDGQGLLLCREYPEISHAYPLEDGQILFLGDRKIRTLQSSPCSYFIQCEDKAIALKKESAYHQDDWARLQSVMPRGFVYGLDDLGNLKTGLISFDEEAFSKGVVV